MNYMVKTRYGQCLVWYIRIARSDAYKMASALLAKGHGAVIKPLPQRSKQ